MQKLRDLYAETQNNSRNNFEKVTLQRCKKILAYANKQCQSLAAQNDFTYIDEILFYQQQYNLIIEKFETAINDKTKKGKLQSDILTILSQNYRNNALSPNQQNPHTPSSPVRKEERIERPKEKQPKGVQAKSIKYEENAIKREQPLRYEQNPLKKELDSRDIIKSYFDMKKNEIQRSQIGFKSVLQNTPNVSKNYAIRSNIQSKKQNNQNITKLTKQIDQLSLKLQQSKKDSQQNLGIIQAQKKEYQAKIDNLLSQINKLNHQNERIRHSTQLMLSDNSPHIQPETIISPVYIQKVHHEEVNDPRVINYRSNDMFKLNQKYHGSMPTHSFNSVKVPSHHNSQIKAIQKVSQNTFQYDKLIKNSQEYFPTSADPFRLQPKLERSNVLLPKLQWQSQQKNIIILSKLNFFQTQKAIYTCEEFDLSIKSTDLIALQSRKITVFINNKERTLRRVNISYDCDPGYYQLTTIKKLVEVQPFKQDKQQIQVKLTNKNDLDFLIQAKLSINNKLIKFIVPTMMVQFLQGRQQDIKSNRYEKYSIKSTIDQFASLATASTIIPLHRDMREAADSGIIYCRSKHHQGILSMTWKSGNQLQIKTIKPWLLFFSYLMMQDY